MEAWIQTWPLNLFPPLKEDVTLPLQLVLRVVQCSKPRVALDFVNFQEFCELLLNKTMI